MGNTWAAAEQRAARQFGVISRAQLIETGLCIRTVRRAVESGTLVKLTARLFRFAASGAKWEQYGLGITQLLARGSALSHQTAGFLWGLPGLESPERSQIHLSVPDRTQPELPPHLIIHRPRLPFRVVTRNGLARTTITRTLIDLAGTENEPRYEAMLDAAHHRFRDLLPLLRSELADWEPHFFRGHAMLAKLLGVRSGGAMASPLETDIFRDLLQARLPRPVAQFDILDPHGAFVCRPDFAWPAHCVALFGDGYAWHHDRKTFDKDATQRTRLAALGWNIVVVTTVTRRNHQWLQDLAALLARTAPQRSLFPPLASAHRRQEPATAPPLQRSAVPSGHLAALTTTSQPWRR